MSNERAKVFAEAVRRFGAADTLHIYSDGLVLVVSGLTDRHLAIRDVLLKDFPGGFEEARAGNLSVFVVPVEVGWKTRPEDLPDVLVVATSGYLDHRQEDAYTLQAALDLFQTTLSNGRSGG